MKQVLYILFGWGLTAIVSWCSGKLLLRRLAVRLSRQEEEVLALLVGSACLSTAVFLLAVLHLVYRAVFLVVSAVVIVPALHLRAWKPRGESLPPMPRRWKLFFLGVWLLFGYVYFIHALAPEASPDGTAYHLDFVARYARERGFPAITNNFYASLPEGMEMLFLFAFVWGRHSAAALVHCTYLLVLPWLILNYGRRIGMPAAGAAGGLLVYLAPVAGIAGTSAYNDVALAAVVFAVFALLEVWYEQDATATLIPAGLLAGFAFAIKYTGFVAAPYAAAFTAYTRWRSRQPVWRPVLLVLLCAFAVSLPALAKNWIIVRNPVSPFLNRVFPNPFVHVSFEEQWSRDLRSYQIHHPWQLAYETTAGGYKTGGLLGPVFLLAPLSLVALRGAPGRRLLLAALVFIVPYPMNVGTRFLLPAVAFLAPGIAMGLGGIPVVALDAFIRASCRISWNFRNGNWHTGSVPVRFVLGGGAAMAILVALHGFFSWPSHINRYAHRYAWRLGRLPVHAALRIESEDQYLLSQMGDGYRMVRFVARSPPPESRIFCLAAPAAAYCAREFLPWYYSAFNLRLRDVLSAGFDAGSQPLRILTFQLSPRSLRGLRLLETSSEKPVTPSINELRIFGPGGELQADRTWHLNAHPFPWEVGLAFDHNPVTRWDAWQQIRKGAWIEIDFGKQEIITAIRVETKPDQAAVHWELQGEASPGTWSALDTTLEQRAVPQPELRRAATETLKRYNVRYILADAQPWVAEFRDHQRQWGLRLLAEFGRWQLYYIE